MGAVHRLRPADLANLWAEGPGAPSQIALVAEFDPGPLTAADGRPDLPRIRAELARRAARIPALGQHVRWTRPGEGLPVWVDDPAADPAVRIGTATLPEGTGLVQWCADRIVVPLDRDGPLWRAEIVGGLPGGRFGLLMVLHHVLADGLAGVALTARLLDPEPGPVPGPALASDAGPDPAPSAGPDPAPDTGPDRSDAAPAGPTARELIADAWRARLHSARAAPGRLPRLPARLRRALRSAATTADELRHRAPRTCLPRHLGAHRRLVAVRVPLDEVRAAGHARGATVNDVVLAAVAAGLRAHVTARGDRVEDLTLPVSMPVARGGGRRGGMVVVGLPVGEPDPGRRLRAITAATSAAKRRLHDGEGDLFDVLRLPVPLARVAVRWLRGRAARHISLFVTDVPGPPQPLWLAGARMVDAVGVAPLSADVALGVTVLSYAGTLALTVNADGAVGSLDVLARGIAGELERLGARHGGDATTAAVSG
ncbi:MAG: wax ester/triacylglycerol synthase domain-containing protein [Pseudonocardia sp.]